jgi:hypothetical protein
MAAIDEIQRSPTADVAERAGTAGARRPGGAANGGAQRAGVATAGGDVGRRADAGRRDIANGGAERAARRTLSGQIARLEREVAAVVSATYPRLDPGPPLPSLAGPRLLSLGELERRRDALAARTAHLRAAAAEQAARQAAAQDELERMLADPPAHRWRRLSNADLGRPGCTTYHVRPRAGLLGMLMGWWQVKVSGGCPLESPPISRRTLPT